jgi:hypothetical protein
VATVLQVAALFGATMLDGADSFDAVLQPRAVYGQRAERQLRGA